MRTSGQTGTIHWTDSAPHGGRAVILLHSLGTDSTMWAGQTGPFSRVRRVIAIDLPGHGRSTAAEAEYTIEDLGGDVLAVADAVGIAGFDLCGISIGGLIALWLAITAPDRVSTLVAAGTAARVGTAGGWEERIRAVSQTGMEGIRPAVVPRFFGSDFPEREPGTFRSIEKTFVSVDPNGYTGCCAALRDADLTELVDEISCPTLVVVGDQDVSTPVADSELLHSLVASSRLEVISGAAHLVNLDRPEDFNAAIVDAWNGW